MFALFKQILIFASFWIMTDIKKSKVNLTEAINQKTEVTKSKNSIPWTNTVSSFAEENKKLVNHLCLPEGCAEFVDWLWDTGTSCG